MSTLDDSDNGHGAGAAFTDLMASLLVVFVLLFVVALNKRVGTQDQQLEDLIRALRGDLQSAGLDAASVTRDSRDKNAVVVVFPDSLLFDVGSEAMRPEGVRIVSAATPRIARVLCSDSLERRIETVVVEGHTDARVPKGESPEEGRASNLRLSQRRSMNVVTQSMVALAQSRDRDCYLTLVSATGRGRENLLPAPVDSLDARQRRVILKIRLRTDVADDVAAAVDGSRK
ncbi:OmpA/MotB family protein [Gemmatimonas sp.]|uniref:OmpA/MotB family protein n=1 Tax=Gemmatimonas sp. TaxID=1962908 RepID=UPI003F71DF16